MTAARGRLLLVPNALDLGHDAVALDAVLPATVLQAAAAVAHWAVEDARSARAFLKRVAERVPLALPLRQQSIVELPRPHKGAPRPPAARGAGADPWHALLAPALAGHDLGLLCEAGLPAVADPGAALVAAAHAAGLAVLPLAGPSALLLALAASGLEGNRFAFVGYVPQAATERALRLRELETLSRRERQTQIVIETPYRNQALFDAMLAALAPHTRLAVAIGLTLPEGWCRTAEIAAWRSAPPRLSDRLPAVFCLLG